MALSRETQEWLQGLKNEGSLSDEVIGQLRAAAEASPKADEYVKGSVLRQADYSRNSAEIQKAKADAERAAVDLANKEAAISKFQTELGQWKAGADAQIIKALKDAEEAETRAQAAASRLARIGAQYGVDPSDLAIEVTPQVKETLNNAPFDTSQFVTKADAGNSVREAVLLDAMIYDLGNEHRDVFGTNLPNAQGLVTEALAAGMPLKKYWSEKYKVSERMAELTESRVQQRIKEAVDAEKTKLASAGALPGGSVGGFRDDLKGSPALREGGIPAPPAEAGGGIRAAVAAFQSGKFRPGAH